MLLLPMFVSFIRKTLKRSSPAFKTNTSKVGRKNPNTKTDKNENEKHFSSM